jgi:hypothetical protein
MLYTDGIHLVADSLDELHSYSKMIGIGKHWFEGVKKGHPHYDIPERMKMEIQWNPAIKKVSSKEILLKSKQLNQTNE